MKFSGYQPAVNPNTINPPSVQAPRDPNAYGGTGRGWGELASGIGQVNKAAAQQRDDEDAAAVVGARNEIMTKLTEGLYGDDGLLTTGVGVNAAGLTDRVTKLIQDTSSEVASKQNGRVSYALKGNLSENISNFQRVAASQEKNEKEKVDTSNYNSALANNNQLAALNYDKKDFVESQIKQNMSLMSARGMSQGWDASTAEANRIGMMTGIIGGVAEAAISGGDYDTAGKVLQQYRKDMNQETYAKLYGVIQKKQDIKETDTQARNIFQACWDATTGKFNADAAKEKIESIYGPNATAVKGGMNIGAGIQSAWNAIGGQQMDNGTKGCAEAATKMASWWSPWAAEQVKAGGQHAVYVPTLVADASKDGGPGVVPFDENNLQTGDMIVYNSPNSGENSHVVIYTGNGPGDYRYMGNSFGQNMTVQGSDYREMSGETPSKVIKTGAGGGSVKSSYDPEKYDMLMRSVNALAAGEEKAYQAKRKDFLDSVMKQAQGAGTYEGAINVIGQSGLDMDEQARMESLAASYYHHNSRSGGGSSGSGRSSRGKTYNPSHDQKTMAVTDMKLKAGKSLSESEQYDRDQASSRLIEAGYAEGGADLDSQQVMSAITDVLNNGGSKDDVRQMLIDSGASETQADYYVETIDSSYD